MSQETYGWLNNMTLVGFTNKRGNAWHYQANEQGDEPNHYTDAIPVEDVRRRLFNWTPVEGSVESKFTFDGGVRDGELVKIIDGRRKTILRLPGTFAATKETAADGSEILVPDPGAILGVFMDGYQIHGYDEWLVKSVATILDDDLSISSAGLLKGGAVGWVEVSVPDNITTPEGVEFRPNLLAATSLDGSLSTTYKRTVTNTVCDNTMSAALGEIGQQIKVKHSRYSNVKLKDARDALAIVHSTAEDFMAEVAELCAVTVTDSQWEQFMEQIAPTKDKDGNLKEGRGLTLAQNKQSGLDKLWRHDNRVQPWAGSAFGVVQAMNTYVQHEGIVRGSGRAERNRLMAVTGGFDKLDAETLTTLNEILTAA